MQRFAMRRVKTLRFRRRVYLFIQTGEEVVALRAMTWPCLAREAN